MTIHSFVSKLPPVIAIGLVWIACEGVESPQPGHEHPGRFDIPTFVNEWPATLQPDSSLRYPGTSTVTPEGTLLVASDGTIYEYNPSGELLGLWNVEVDGVALYAIHVRCRYGKYYLFVFVPGGGSRLLIYDWQRQLVLDTPIVRAYRAVPFASLDVDLHGNVYVLYFDDELVIKYDSRGRYETQWHTWGSNPTGDNWPGGIVVSPVGTVYVTDTLHNRILVFDSWGHLLQEWGEGGNGNGQYHWPIGIDSDRAGYLYVVDSLNNRVEKLDRTGTYVGEFQSLIPAAPDHSTTPEGIAIGGNDVYVFHSTARLIRHFAF